MSTTTHLDIEHALARARARHTVDVAGANARLEAFVAAMQRQCGAGPGHVFTKANPDSERQAMCVWCGADRRTVAGATNQSPRENETWLHA